MERIELKKRPEILQNAPFVGVLYKNGTDTYFDILHYSEITIPDNFDVEILKLVFMDADRKIFFEVNKSDALQVLHDIEKIK